MKTQLLLLGLLVGTVTLAGGATNDLSSLLQKGLFEEEANHNLGAAIQAYESVVTQIDKDRKLAATAVFRLGECYRKQGNTNEASAQYERVLREFPEQSILVNLSRQNLAASGNAPLGSTAPAPSPAVGAERARLDAEIAELRSLPKDKLRIAIQQNYPNPVLTSLMQQLVQAEQDLKARQLDYGPEHPEVRKAAALEQTINKQVDDQIEGALKGLMMKRDAVAKADEAAQAQPGPGSGAQKGPTASNSAEAGEISRIQAIIKDSPDLINAPEKNGETLLQAAAAKGKMAVARLLLESGAAVDGIKQPGLTPLHFAAANGHKAMVELLLSKGAKVNASTESGLTPLHLAALKGYEAVARTLVDAGAQVNAPVRASGGTSYDDLSYQLNASGQTALHLAAGHGYAAIVELLVAKGAELNTEDGDGRTALSLAAQNRFAPMIKILLAAKADPNAGTAYLPLAVAAYCGDMPSLELLLAGGADPNLKALVKWGINLGSYSFPQGTKCSPLFLAVSQKRPAFIQQLIRFKANPNDLDPVGYPLLYDAIADLPTLDALLEGGADPNQLPQKTDFSVLARAVLAQQKEAVAALLAHGANVGPGRSEGDSTLFVTDTPLHLAAVQGNLDLAELLLNKGADVNARNAFGQTPLHLAVREKKPDMVRWLVEHKADPNAQDKDGHTPLDVAKSNEVGVYAGPSAVSFATEAPRPGLPFRGVALPPGSVSVPPAPAPSPNIAEVLRKHGAVDELPRLDRIGIRLPSSPAAALVFTKEPEDSNQFTLLDLVGIEYALLAGSPRGDPDWRSSYRLLQLNRFPSGLAYPDLAHVRIRHPGADLKSWQERTVDLTPLLESGDCSSNPSLNWGDVVEVEEQDHTLNESWAGFDTKQMQNLAECLSREVEIVIKGQPKKVRLGPTPANASGTVFRGEWKKATFWLKPALLESKLLLASSDLSRVKVTRMEVATGQKREWVLDCSKDTSPEFWLLDGDVIEVPEK